MAATDEKQTKRSKRSKRERDVIFEFDVDEYKITFRKIPLEEAILQGKAFMGQKILHPIETVKAEETYSFKGKRGNMITKTASCLVYGDSFIPGVEELIKTARITYKHDGRAVWVRYDPTTDSHQIYARIDIQIDKTTGEPKKIPGDNWIECEAKPTNKVATHWPHFRPVTEDPKDYRWIIEAFDKFKATGLLTDIKASFTAEAMGKKCQYCKSDPIEDNMVIIPHGCIEIDIPSELRTVEGIKKVLTHLSFMEGLVMYLSNGQIYKIRRDMFMGENGQTRLQWPAESVEFYASKFGEPFSSGDGISSLVRPEILC